MKKVFRNELDLLEIKPVAAQYRPCVYSGTYPLASREGPCSALRTRAPVGQMETQAPQLTQGKRAGSPPAKRAITVSNPLPANVKTL
jgi:hypothetical protein